MIKVALRLLIACLLSSCASVPPPAVIHKTTWVHCWQACGKGDRLNAVSTEACHCQNGGIIPLNPHVELPESVKPNEAGLFDRIMALFKSE